MLSTDIYVCPGIHTIINYKKTHEMEIPIATQYRQLFAYCSLSTRSRIFMAQMQGAFKTQFTRLSPISVFFVLPRYRFPVFINAPRITATGAPNTKHAIDSTDIIARVSPA